MTHNGRFCVENSETRNILSIHLEVQASSTFCLAKVALNRFSVEEFNYPCMVRAWDKHLNQHFTNRVSYRDHRLLYFTTRLNLTVAVIVAVSRSGTSNNLQWQIKHLYCIILCWFFQYHARFINTQHTLWSLYWFILPDCWICIYRVGIDGNAHHIWHTEIFL
jgi:hypothetical protein